MREHMGFFRGKRIDNAEWVEGAFLNDRGTTYICPAVSDITYGDNGNRRRIGCWYKVDPNTVGECTGLTDKNGKLIFEGDIVRLEGKELPYWYEEGDCVEVKYNDCGFNPFAEYDSDCGAYVHANLCTIIGTVHYNPELLKGGEADE